MPFFEITKQLISPTRRVQFLLIGLIIALLILGYVIVQATGGTAFAYLHILYIPIILAGLTFSLPGGIIVGILAGFLMGPYIPSSYAYEAAQPFSSWFFRLTMFTLVGAMSGAGASVFRKYIRELELKQITDSLTGLPNLWGLTKNFQQLLEKKEKALIVVGIELPGMHEINKVLGEEGTSILMRQVAEHLQEAVGDDGVLGRLQAHHFAILIPDEKKVLEILRKCEEQAATTYSVNTIPLFVEMRFGVSRYPTDDKDLSNLTRKALIAIHALQDQAQRICYYNNLAINVSERNILILHQFKIALEQQLLTLEYQPKEYLQTGKVMSFEALVRWHDPLLGTIGPMEFIPLIEDTLLILPFTHWVLETALSQLQRWREQDVLVPISINFSIKNLYDQSLIQKVIDLLDVYKIPPHFLEIEVTETSIASSISKIAQALSKIREIGVRLSIDDFGTGQASQQYLFELPINAIKIDKVFIDSITHSAAAASIVKNAISLAHELKLDVISEGVETRNQYDLLAKWGCDGAQGYLISKSMPEEVATSWLKDRQKAGTF